MASGVTWSRMRRLTQILLLLGLGAIFIPKLGDFVSSTETKVARSDIYEFKSALGLFRADVGRYPTTQEGLAALVRPPRGLQGWHGPYLARKDIPTDPWKHAYVYRCPGEFASYELASYGRDGRKGGGGEDRDISD